MKVIFDCFNKKLYKLYITFFINDVEIKNSNFNSKYLN